MPSPTNALLKELEKICYDFIWKKKRHEVSKTTLCLSWEQGGLGLINIQEFDNSLKLTWLKKMFANTPDWLEFATAYNIDRLLWTGPNYHTIIRKKCHNPFWASVILAYNKWYKSLDSSKNIAIADQPIWGNTTLNIPFNKILFTSNIVFLKDLYDQEGNPRTKAQLELITGSNIMLTTYHALWKSQPKLWKETLRVTNTDFNLYLPPVINWLMKDKKGTKNIRKVWNLQRPAILPKGPEKWTLEFAQLDPNIWNKIFLIPKQCKVNSRIIYFQFQIIHRSLITNKKLFTFGLRDNENCELCNIPESINHLLYDCPNAREIWTDLEYWLRTVIRSTIYMDILSILLGNPRNEVVINCILLIVKHEIYKRKWNGSNLNLLKIKRIIKSHMDLDIYLGTIHGKPEKAIGKWSSIFHNLQLI